jgi:hypothetical protein
VESILKSLVRFSVLLRRRFDSASLFRFPQELEDPHLGLIKITVEGAEYWDSASSLMVRAVGYVKAALGNPSTIEGDHKKVNFP